MGLAQLWRQQQQFVFWPSQPALCAVPITQFVSVFVGGCILKRIKAGDAKPIVTTNPTGIKVPKCVWVEEGRSKMNELTQSRREPLGSRVMKACTHVGKIRLGVSFTSESDG